MIREQAGEEAYDLDQDGGKAETRAQDRDAGQALDPGKDPVAGAPAGAMAPELTLISKGFWSGVQPCP